MQVQELYAKYHAFHLLVDSRQLLDPASTLFFALPGRRADGHRFVPELYRRGVRHFVVNQAVEDCPEATFVAVDDVLATLQALAAHHRRQFDIPVVAVTGSNGKTIVKEWLYQLLSPRFRIVRSPRSYNSQVGVPLSVWQLRAEHELAIFEAGISTTGEMQRLEQILRPTIGIFTNIGEAHREGFASREEKLREKLLLFKNVDRLIYCRDQEQVHLAIAGLGRPAISWSTQDKAAELLIEAVERLPAGLAVRLRYGTVEAPFFLPFADAPSLENALHAAALCLYLGLEPRTLADGMAHLEPLGLRLELRAGRDGSRLIDDSYSNDLTSLAAALTFLNQQEPPARRTLILSDIPQTGLEPDQLYRQVAQLIAPRIDRLIGVGPEVVRLREYLPAELAQQFYFPSTEALLPVLDRLDVRGDYLLLKGARAFGFERVAARLARQVHRTELEVDLSALTHNLEAFRRHLRPGVKLAVMVKASAYGSGSLPVAALLERQRVDYLVVAYPDEGAELREGGIHLPIMVLNTEPAGFDLLLRHRLEPEIYSAEQLHELADYTAGSDRPLTLHLKLDTGMHRLGFGPEAARAVGRYLRAQPQFQVGSVFTHLAASEDPAEDEYTHRQVALFEEAYQQLVAELGYRPARHVLNSSGIARFPQYQYEMVRLGIGLYGLESSGALAAETRPVLSLRARVSQVRELEAGATVGYNRRGRVTRPSRIAVLSIGYADGLPRAAGNGRFAIQLHGRPAPIIGSVCMDMTMVDVTDIPEVRAGDTALLFGPGWPVTKLAEAAGTIPYEILTGLRGRIHRVYVQE